MLLGSQMRTNQQCAQRQKEKRKKKRKEKRKEKKNHLPRRIALFYFILLITLSKEQKHNPIRINGDFYWLH